MFCFFGGWGGGGGGGGGGEGIIALRMYACRKFVSQAFYSGVKSCIMTSGRVFVLILQRTSKKYS